MQILEAIQTFIISIFSPGGFFILLGLLIFILELLYVVFAFIIIKQVALMNDSLKTGFATLFTFLVYVHFFAALGLVIISAGLLF